MRDKLKLKEVFARNSDELHIIDTSIRRMSFDQFLSAVSELGVWMSDEEIEKAAIQYALQQGVNYPLNNAYLSMISAQIRKAFSEGMKHYRDNASPVRFVTDEEINEAAKAAELDDKKSSLSRAVSNMLKYSFVDGARWMRDLIFKNKEG